MQSVVSCCCVCWQLAVTRQYSTVVCVCVCVCVCVRVCVCAAGIVYDETQNYDNSFHVGGAMLLAGGLLVCTLHLPQLRRLAADVRLASLNSDSDSQTSAQQPAASAVQRRHNAMTLTVGRDDRLPA